MKIISKYSDFYDSVQGVMYDDDIKYIRKCITHDLDVAFSYIGLQTFNDLILIGFCGKIYPMIQFTQINNSINKDIKKWIIKNNKKLIKTQGDGFPNTYINYDLNEGIPITFDDSRFWYSKRDTKRFISTIQNDVKRFESMKLFDKYETPIFVIKHVKNKNNLVLESGSALKDYNFQKVMDPYTAYQELVMWIGNQAINEYPPQITDNIVLRDSKGFDKMSFKKYPTKHFKK